MSSFGVGGSARPQAAPYPLRTPRSPTGHTSSRPSWKMRNISAVQRPMPGTVERRVTSSSSPSCSTSWSGTTPLSVASARPRIARVLAADRPAPRRASSGTASTFSGVRSTASPPPVTAVTNRPKMAAAARPASCWKTMLRQRAPKWESPRRRSSSGGPRAATSRPMTGSRPASSLVPFRRTAGKFGEAKSGTTGALRAASADVGAARRGMAEPYSRPPMEPDGIGLEGTGDGRAAAEAVLTSDPSDEAALRRVVEILAATHPSWGWVGVYLLVGDTLVLGPFVGPPTEHTRIPVGRGVCGTAVAEDRNVVVEDVRHLDNYLACSVGTRSEIVVLIRDGGDVVGQFDVDSDDLAAFGPADE